MNKPGNKGKELTEKYFRDNEDVSHAREILDKREIALDCIQGLINSSRIEDAKKYYSDYVKKNPTDEKMASALADFEVPHWISIKFRGRGPINIPIVSVRELQRELGFDTPLDYPKTSLLKPFSEWKMEIDDSPIFRYVYRHFKPCRHLEFGTWQGAGCFIASKSVLLLFGRSMFLLEK
jgi:hypothetical protein